MRSDEEIMGAPGLRDASTLADPLSGGLMRCARIDMERWTGTVIWSDFGGWDHVSVAPLRRGVVPSWADMSRIKRLFFKDDEWAVEYHPPSEANVDLVGNCLHLWRPQDGSLPTPP